MITLGLDPSDPPVKLEALGRGIGWRLSEALEAGPSVHGLFEDSRNRVASFFCNS